MKIYVPIAPTSKFSYELILLTCSAVLETKCSKIASCLIIEIWGGWAMKDKIGESSPGSKDKGHKDGTDNSIHCSEESSTENAFKPQLKYM